MKFMRIMHKVSKRLGLKIKKNSECIVKRILFASV